MIPAKLQNLHITLPIAGQVAVVPVTTSAIGLDLASIGGPSPGNPENAAVNANDPAAQGLLNAYITLYADTADVGLIASDMFAKVTGAAAPVLANAGSVNSSSGAYTPNISAGECIRILAGTSIRVRPTVATRYLGLVGSTTGKLRISLSSPT